MQSFPLRSSQQGDSPPIGEGQGSTVADGLIGRTSSVLAKIELDYFVKQLALLGFSFFNFFCLSVYVSQVLQ